MAVAEAAAPAAADQGLADEVVQGNVEPVAARAAMDRGADLIGQRRLHVLVGLDLQDPLAQAGRDPAALRWLSSGKIPSITRAPNWRAISWVRSVQRSATTTISSQKSRRRRQSASRASSLCAQTRAESFTGDAPSREPRGVNSPSII